MFFCFFLKLQMNKIITTIITKDKSHIVFINV